jgi:NADP-dependent 3-hydroxy acid dehydrogenase YdfG
MALNFDIRDRKAAEQLINGMPENWKNIDVLVNNAGLALGMNAIQDGSMDDWDQMIDTNLKGLLYMSRLITPLMIAKSSGHVINLGSVAGKEIYPNGNVYCATKFAVDGLTKAIRLDLYGHGIRVTQIAPGMTGTEFSMVRFRGDKERAKKIYEGFKTLTPDGVAEVIYYVTTLPEHVNISDLIIMPSAQASAIYVKRNN